jgi:hypothetical protein
VSATNLLLLHILQLHFVQIVLNKVCHQKPSLQNHDHDFLFCHDHKWNAYSLQYSVHLVHSCSIEIKRLNKNEDFILILLFNILNLNLYRTIDILTM